MRLSDDTIGDYAETLVLQVRGGGRDLDYSEASVGVVEELLRVSDPLLRLETFPDAQRNLVVFYNGCYLGEVMSRQLGGVWRFEENWFDSSLVFAYGDGGLQARPFQKVHRRITERPEENDLTAYYDELKARLRRKE